MKKLIVLAAIACMSTAAFADMYDFLGMNADLAYLVALQQAQAAADQQQIQNQQQVVKTDDKNNTKQEVVVDPNAETWKTMTNNVRYNAIYNSEVANAANQSERQKLYNEASINSPVVQKYRYRDVNAESKNNFRMNEYYRAANLNTVREQTRTNIYVTNIQEQGLRAAVTEQECIKEFQRLMNWGSTMSEISRRCEMAFPEMALRVAEIKSAAYAQGADQRNMNIVANGGWRPGM